MNAKKLKTTVRNYQGADSYMTECARIIYYLLMKYLPQFTAFDSTINKKYCANFIKTIELADTVGSDRTPLSEQQRKVTAVNLLMKNAGKKYVDVMYFVDKAFPYGAIKRTFGFGDYTAAKNNRIKMFALLEIMEAACKKNRVALNDVGFSDTDIDNIVVIKEQLQGALLAKNSAKKLRKKQTEERITILNNCYDFVTAINSAAQLVYAGDTTKQKQFVYLPLKVRESKKRIKKAEVPPASE